MTTAAMLTLAIAATHLVLACALVRATARSAEAKGVRVVGERRAP